MSDLIIRLGLALGALMASQLAGALLMGAILRALRNRRIRRLREDYLDGRSINEAETERRLRAYWPPHGEVEITIPGARPGEVVWRGVVRGSIEPIPTVPYEIDIDGSDILERINNEQT